MRPLLYQTLCATCGLVWGALAMGSGYATFGAVVWAGFIASPLIGMVIGWLYRFIHHLPFVLHFALPLVSLYVGAMLFGGAVGAGDIVAHWKAENVRSIALIPQTVLGVWWGLTFGGLVLFFGPLAILNHLILRQLDRDMITSHKC